MDVFVLEGGHSFIAELLTTGHRVGTGLHQPFNILPVAGLEVVVQGFTELLLGPDVRRSGVERPRRQ